MANITPEKLMLQDWTDLANKHDDLKYILLKYGKSIDCVRLVMQQEFHKAANDIEALESRMAASGKFRFPDQGEPTLIEQK